MWIAPSSNLISCCKLSVTRPCPIPTFSLFQSAKQTLNEESVWLTFSDGSTGPFQSPSVDKSLQTTPRRIRQPTLNLSSAQIFETSSDSSEGSAGTGRTDESGETAGEGFRLRVDFGSGGGDVNRSVTFVITTREMWYISEWSIGKKGGGNRGWTDSNWLTLSGISKFVSHLYLRVDKNNRSAYHAALSNRSACRLASVYPTIVQFYLASSESREQKNSTHDGYSFQGSRKRQLYTRSIRASHATNSEQSWKERLTGYGVNFSTQHFQQINLLLTLRL